MPPSGFTDQNAVGIRDFLFSCATELRRQNESSRAPKEALSREIRDIVNDLSSRMRPSVSRSILDLCHEFYHQIDKTLAHDSSWDEFDDSAAHVNQLICTEITDIKVAETV